MLQPLQGCFRFPREPGVRFATPGYLLKSLRDRRNKPKDLHRNRSRSRSRSREGSHRHRLPGPTWTDEEPDWPILSARVGIGIGIGIEIENKEEYWHRSRSRSGPSRRCVVEVGDRRVRHPAYNEGRRLKATCPHAAV
jgi:hypothetical protein